MPNFVGQLGQLRPADTTAAAVYTKVQDATVWLDQLFICNTTASSADFRVFHDDDGTTYNETTALFFDEALAANTTRVLDLKMYMSTASGTIGVRTDTNSALTFTLYGEEVFS